jgi:hypothetical protein
MNTVISYVFGGLTFISIYKAAVARMNLSSCMKGQLHDKGVNNKIQTLPYCYIDHLPFKVYLDNLNHLQVSGTEHLPSLFEREFKACYPKEA